VSRNNNAYKLEYRIFLWLRLRLGIPSSIHQGAHHFYLIFHFFFFFFFSAGGLKDGIEFLVLLRLWRITRIINGNCYL